MGLFVDQVFLFRRPQSPADYHREVPNASERRSVESGCEDWVNHHGQLVGEHLRSKDVSRLEDGSSPRPNATGWIRAPRARQNSGGVILQIFGT